MTHIQVIGTILVIIGGLILAGSLIYAVCYVLYSTYKDREWRIFTIFLALTFFLVGMAMISSSLIHSLK